MLVYWRGYQDIFKPKMYTDAKWAGDKETQRSTSAYVILVNRFAVLYSSKRQTTVAWFLCEIDYIAASEATKEAV